MIIESILNILYSLITTIFGLLPSIPSFPTDLDNSILTVFDTIFSNVNLLKCFVKIDTLFLFVPIVIILLNFDTIYNITMFIVKKIPGFNID